MNFSLLGDYILPTTLYQNLKNLLIFGAWEKAPPMMDDWFISRHPVPPKLHFYTKYILPSGPVICYLPPFTRTRLILWKKVRSIDPTFFKRLVIWGHPCELWRNQPPPPWSKPFYPPRNSRPYESGLGRPLVFFPFFFLAGFYINPYESWGEWCLLGEGWLKIAMSL